MLTNLDIVIFAAFLGLNIIVGLYYGRKVQTIKDYALGGRNFSTGALVSTIVATWIGGDYLFITLSEVYTTGLHYAIACCGMAICLLITGYIFAPRMGEFLGNISIAEAMGDLYGKEARLITAITGSIAAAGFIGLQFKVFGNIFNFFLGTSSTNAVILAALITVAYSVVGGIRSVAFTDVIQFFTFGVLIPVISIIIWNDTYNLENFNLATATNNVLFNYNEFIGLENPKFWKLIFLMVLFALPSFDPAIFQRISMARNVKQVKAAFNISALIVLLTLAGMSWIAFLLFNVNPDIDPNNLVYYIIDNYGHHTGLKIFILIGIISMCMSTADSNINAASVTLAHDFCYPLGIGSRNEVLLSKILSAIIGCGSIVLALSKQNMLELVFMTQSFFTPLVGIPFVLAIFGFRSTKKAMLTGMGAAFISVIIWRMFFMDTGIESLIPGMFFNLIFFLGSHYLLKQKGGWIGIKDTNELAELKNNRRKMVGNFTKRIRNFDFFHIVRSHSPKDELTYSGFGIFGIISTIFTMYSLANSSMEYNKNIPMIFYESMLIVSVFFATYPIWPTKLKSKFYAPLLWNLSTFYILVFCSSFFVLLSNFGHLQFVIFTVNLIVMAILSRWSIAIVFILIGCYCSLTFYKHYTNVETIALSIGSTSFILYSLLLIGTAIIIFLKPKQELHEVTHQKAEHLTSRLDVQEKEVRNALALRGEFIRNISHEYHASMTGIFSMAQILKDSYQKLSEEQRLKAVDIILKNSARLDIFDSNISSLAQLAKANYKLRLEEIDLSNLLHDRIAFCHKIYKENREDDNFILNIANGIKFKGDKYYLTQVFDNLITNAISYCKNGKISITMSLNQSGICFTIEDEGIGIPHDELLDIFGEFVVSSKTRTPAGNRGVGLALCKRVIEVHGGTITARSNGVKGASFSFTLPV